MGLRRDFNWPYELRPIAREHRNFITPKLFDLDPNVHGVLVNWGSDLCCIRRRAIYAAGHPQWSLIRFSSVHAFRVREWSGTAELEACVSAPDVWVTAFEDSEYLAETRAKAASAAETSSSLRHYVVSDGWERAIDVLATGHTLQAESNLIVLLKDLGESIELP
jgi:hypothetical protein